MGSGVLKGMEWSKRILIFSYLMLVVFIVIFLAADDKAATTLEPYPARKAMSTKHT